MSTCDEKLYYYPIPLWLLPQPLARLSLQRSCISGNQFMPCSTNVLPKFNGDLNHLPCSSQSKDISTVPQHRFRIDWSIKTLCMFVKLKLVLLFLYSPYRKARANLFRSVRFCLPVESFDHHIRYGGKCSDLGFISLKKIGLALGEVFGPELKLVTVRRTRSRPCAKLGGVSGHVR